MPGIFTLYAHYQSVMTPPQLATQCVAFFIVGVCFIELAHILQVGVRQTAAKYTGNKPLDY